MITINLKPGQKRDRGGPSFSGLGAQWSALRDRVKDPMLLGAVGLAAVVVLFLGWTFISNATTLSRLDTELEQAQEENRRFQNLVKELRREEAIRDSLVSQINVIRTVDGDRFVWSHVLDEVARALPAYTWLVDLSSQVAPTPVDGELADSTAPQKVEFELTGRTVDIAAYTRFLRQLEASPWLTDVRPVRAETVVEGGRPVTAFSIRVAFQRADSAYIRTAPLSQSVR